MCINTYILVGILVDIHARKPINVHTCTYLLKYYSLRLRDKMIDRKPTDNPRDSTYIRTNRRTHTLVSTFMNTDQRLTEIIC